MVTERQAERAKAIKVGFADEAVTQFTGLAVVKQTARRLGLWREVERTLPARIVSHAQMVKATLLGVFGTARRRFEHYWGACCRC